MSVSSPSLSSPLNHHGLLAFERWIDIVKRTKGGQVQDLSLTARQVFNELKSDTSFSWLVNYIEKRMEGVVVGDTNVLEPATVFCVLTVTDPAVPPAYISQSVQSLRNEGNTISLASCGLLTLGVIATRCGSLGDLVTGFETILKGLLLQWSATQVPSLFGASGRECPQSSAAGSSGSLTTPAPTSAERDVPPLPAPKRLGKPTEAVSGNKPDAWIMEQLGLCRSSLLLKSSFDDGFSLPSALPTMPIHRAASSSGNNQGLQAVPVPSWKNRTRSRSLSLGVDSNLLSDHSMSARRSSQVTEEHVEEVATQKGAPPAAAEVVHCSAVIVAIELLTRCGLPRSRLLVHRSVATLLPDLEDLDGARFTVEMAYQVAKGVALNVDVSGFSPSGLVGTEYEFTSTNVTAFFEISPSATATGARPRPPTHRTQSVDETAKRFPLPTSTNQRTNSLSHTTSSLNSTGSSLALPLSDAATRRRRSTVLPPRHEIAASLGEDPLTAPPEEEEDSKSLIAEEYKAFDDSAAVSDGTQSGGRASQPTSPMSESIARADTTPIRRGDGLGEGANNDTLSGDHRKEAEAQTPGATESGFEKEKPRTTAEKYEGSTLPASERDSDFEEDTKTVGSSPTSGGVKTTTAGEKDAVDDEKSKNTTTKKEKQAKPKGRSRSAAPEPASADGGCCAVM